MSMYFKHFLFACLCLCCVPWLRAQTPAISKITVTSGERNSQFVVTTNNANNKEVLVAAIVDTTADDTADIPVLTPAQIRSGATQTSTINNIGLNVVSISGLEPGVRYIVYSFIFEDGTPNTALSTIFTKRFKTKATAPAFTGTPPIRDGMSHVTHTQTSITFVIRQLNIPSHVYCLAIPTSAGVDDADISKERIKDGYLSYVNTNETLTDGVNKQYTVAGLVHSTEYRLHLYAVGVNGGLESPIYRVTRSTTDVTAPVVSAISYAQDADCNHVYNISLTSSEAGTLYMYINLAVHATRDLTAAEISRHTPFNVVAGANTITLKNIFVGHAYKIQFVVQDAANNFSAITRQTFTLQAGSDYAINSISSSDVRGGSFIVTFTPTFSGYLSWGPGAVSRLSFNALLARELRAGTASRLSGVRIPVVSGKLTQILFSDFSGNSSNKAFFFIEEDTSQTCKNISKFEDISVGAINVKSEYPLVSLQSTSLTGANIDDISGTFTYTSAQTGMFYWIVQAASLASPDLAKIKAGNGGDGNNAVASGTSTYGTANTPVSVDIEDLEAETSYLLYYVLEDGSSIASAVSYHSFTTPAPEFVANAQPLTAVTQTSATFNYQTSASTGTVYWVVYAADVVAPTQAAVKTPTGTAVVSGNASTDGLAATASITSLTAGTSYKIYYIIEKTGGILSRIYETAFSSLPNPGFVAAPAITPAATTATLVVQPNQAGTVYWVVYTAADAGDRELNAGQVQNPFLETSKGKHVFSTKPTASTTLQVTGLAISTAYKNILCLCRRYR